MSSQANWIGVAGELIEQWTRRHLAWTAHYDVYPWCIDQVLIVVVGGGEKGEAISRTNKQTAWVTPLRQATVGRQSRILKKRRTLPHPLSTLQALSPDSATAFMAKVLHRKSSSTWYGTGMELSQTHTHACPLPSQASSRHPKRACHSFPPAAFFTAGAFFTEIIDKTLLACNTNIDILWFRKRPPPPFLFPALPWGQVCTECGLFWWWKFPIRSTLENWKRMSKLTKLPTKGGQRNGRRGNMSSRGSHNQLRNCRKTKTQEKS